MQKTFMTKWRAGKWCGMPEIYTPIPAIPADLRGKEMSIPAGYLDENKQTAGKAGIEPNSNMCAGNRFMCDARLHALECGGVGSYPRFPRRARVFKHLGCGDRWSTAAAGRMAKTPEGSRGAKR